MVITLTPTQWKALYPLVLQGRQSEKSLGVPVDINNGDQKIEIAADEIKITLGD